ncbi:ABC transporter ATP-binding protein [Celerinatantimonas sp. MCCC 1A17872]|uniref:ABC transporter ATP-binding protein n=1 Tax=Celerinatantimonas sp. MCCC 1A17872 TaxID=3177514 RepID=UPI0038C9C117
MQFSVHNLKCGYNDKAIVQNVSFNVQAGEILCILGPNGVGKSTLFKSMLNLIPRLGGDIKVDGKSLDGCSRKDLATLFGYVPQAGDTVFPFTVRDMVAMGRTAHLSMFGFPSKDDLKQVDDAMYRLGIMHLASRRFSQLSGGEQQMVLIARALAQAPLLLAMDEPTASLDFGNQVAVLRQVRRLADEGLAIVMITHSPEQAFLCASKVLLFRRNQPCLFGPVDEIVTEQNLHDAYGVDVRINNIGQQNGRTIRSCTPIVS